MLGLVEWLFAILLKKRAPAALIDVTWGDPAARAIRAALAAGDFAGAEQQLGQAADTQTLDHWIQACSDWDGRPGWLDDWVQRRPDSALARMIRGAQCTHWAWQARSSRTADQVDNAAFAEFFRRLELAEADLDAAQRLDPASALPAALMLRVLTGQQADDDHKRATFEQAVSRAPTLLSAHRAMFSAQCAKWGGSDAAMLAFAREHAVRSSALRVLIPLAHIEVFIGIDDLEQRRAYARQPQVRAEVDEAFARFREGRDEAALRNGANAFAFQFVLAKDVKRAEQAFALTAGFVSPVPWMYIGDPLAMYTRMRASLT
ncbi:MAG TPA: hypothetical protein VN259_02605 [Xanthomonadales bacterium]|nr:hypothetical protein [Xanthomonadales bacterium]